MNEQTEATSPSCAGISCIFNIINLWFYKDNLAGGKLLLIYGRVNEIYNVYPALT